MGKANSHYIAEVQSVSLHSYHELFAAMQQPPLYVAPWWLDATCGPGGWDAAILQDTHGNPVAGLPYHLTRIRGLQALITPPFTQWVTPVSSSIDLGNYIPSLLSSLPRVPILDLCLKPDTSLDLAESVIPAALKYSYIIPGTTRADQLRTGYSEGLRRNLNKAEKLHSIAASSDINGFLALCRQSHAQQKISPPQWLHAVIPEVYKGLMTYQCGHLMMAYAEGKAIAGILTAWDQHTSYYLAGGRTGDEHGASAHALLLDHAVHAALDRGNAFDFEGSMHPGIANFFQSFGALPASYWRFRKFKGLGRVWSLFH